MATVETSINLYFLSSTPMVKILPKLLMQIIQKHKVLMLFKNEIEMKEMDDLLWSAVQQSFVPHATQADALPQKQPVLLSTNSKALNNADVMICCDLTRLVESIGKYSKILCFFQNNQEELHSATMLQEQLQNINCNYLNFRQNNDGSWS